MRNLILSIAILSLFPAAGRTQSYPALSDYMMSRDAEIALAKSAAPVNISDHATVKVLTTSGYQVAREGKNGFVCMVLRGWAAPTYTPAQLRDLVYDAKTRAPICFDPKASQIVVPYYELRSKLAMQGETPDHIAEQVQAAYAKGQLPQRDGVSFGYMWSADQILGPAGHWHPHMMLFLPYARNHEFGDPPFGSMLPAISDDEGTPFAVVVIPVDEKLAVKARP